MLGIAGEVRTNLKVTGQGNADGIKKFLHLSRMSLNSCVAPTIKWPWAIFWHDRMLDKSQWALPISGKKDQSVQAVQHCSSKSKDGDRCRGRPELSLFNSYYTDEYRRALLLSQDCPTLPLIHNLYCWVLSKEESTTNFKVFGMTQPEIEPRYPGPLANTLPVRPMSVVPVIPTYHHHFLPLFSSSTYPQLLPFLGYSS